MGMRRYITTEGTEGEGTLTLRQLKSCSAQSLMVPSAEAVASTWSVGENWTFQRPRRWPVKTPNSWH